MDCLCITNRIYLISFLDTFSIGLSIPFLAPYLRSIGASHLTIGLSSSLYGIAQLLSSPIVGSWSDHSGRLPVLSLSLGVCSICYLLIGLINSVYFILLLRFIIGCFKHTQSLCSAILADRVLSSQYSSACGTLIAVSGVGFVLGPAIGGHLALTNNDITYVSATIMVCFWFNIALVQTLPPCQQQKRSSRDSEIDFQNMQIFRHLQHINWEMHRSVLMLKLSLAYSTSLYFNNFSLTLREKYDLSTTSVGYIISFQALIQSLSALALGKVQKMDFLKGKSKSFVGQCFVMLTIAIVGLYLTSSIPMLLFWLTPFSISQSLLRSFLMELLVKNASSAERGSLLGASESISGLGRLSAPIMAGIATDQLNASAVPLLTIITAAAGALISFV